ncbi:MAG: hypothetical protein IJQ73_00495 [Kiritimatiellae bacterium]|nr:hypothetical protein [Kiritimatiellia bacterium]
MNDVPIQALDHTQPLLQLRPGSNDTVCGARRSMPWESCGNTFGGSS